MGERKAAPAAAAGQGVTRSGGCTPALSMGTWLALPLESCFGRNARGNAEGWSSGRMSERGGWHTELLPGLELTPAQPLRCGQAGGGEGLGRGGGRISRRGAEVSEYGGE